MRDEVDNTMDDTSSGLSRPDDREIMKEDCREAHREWVDDAPRSQKEDLLH